MSELPLTVRLSIEGMREQVVHHAQMVFAGYDESLRQAIDHAIKTYPWEEQITEIIHNEIRSKIELYFLSGKGAEVIRCGIDEAFRRAQAGQIPEKRDQAS